MRAVSVPAERSYKSRIVWHFPYSYLSIEGYWVPSSSTMAFGPLQVLGFLLLIDYAVICSRAAIFDEATDLPTTDFDFIVIGGESQGPTFNVSHPHQSPRLCRRNSWERHSESSYRRSDYLCFGA